MKLTQLEQWALDQIIKGQGCRMVVDLNGVPCAVTGNIPVLENHIPLFVVDNLERMGYLAPDPGVDGWPSWRVVES